MGKPRDEKGRRRGAHACPCNSGHDYRACCGPLHRGHREAVSAVALMRSRYAAFALGEAEYLWRTLHADHEDRARPRELVVPALADARRTLRYMGLAILDAREDGGEAEVLFSATIFERGHDRSFVELSRFLHDGEGWRYLSGVTVPTARLGRDPAGLTIAAFSALRT